MPEENHRDFLLLELLLTDWDINFLQHELAAWIAEQEGSLKIQGIIVNSRHLGVEVKV